MRLQPITRKERFLYEIVGCGETAPKNELTTEELFFAKILGRNVTLPDLSNVPKYYLFLAKIAGENVNVTPPTYVSPPLEFFLAKAAGMDVETPIPRTREEIFWAAYTGTEIEIEGVPPLTFKSNGANLSNYRIYGNTVNGESVGDLVQSGEHAGEYLVPVTINSNTTSIYLPYQIRKVGDEAEYIDYEEQKQHKVRKNLFNGSEPFSNVDVDTKSQLDIWFRFYSVGSSSQMAAGSAIDAQIGQRIIRTVNPREDYERLVVKHNGAAKDIIIISEILEVGKTYVVSFDITSNDIQTVGGVVISKIQIEEGSEATDYEPYIQDTELDVELPVLPTLSGTNTLSVETTVQPSKVVVKGEIGGAS